MLWLYDIPTSAMVALISGSFVVLSWVGLLLIRPLLRLAVRRNERGNELVGTILSSHGIYYGLLLGLLAVASYQNYAQVSDIVSNEAASLAALYRDVSSYPEPTRSKLQDLLREYTRFVIEDAWPRQRRGIIAEGGVARATAFQTELMAFEPTTKGQELLHGETLRQNGHTIELRRARLQAVTTSLPTILWYVVAIGALVSIILVWLLEMSLFSHLLLGGLLAFFNGTLISLVIAMDHPFRGEVSVSPEAFQIVYQSLMLPDAAQPAGEAPSRPERP